MTDIPRYALTARAVEQTFINCLSGHTDLTNPDITIMVEGIVTKVAFSRAKIGIFHETIRDYLMQLPAGFLVSGKDYEGAVGGWSFLQMCVDRDENQWGEHPDMERLCMLGIAAGMIKWCAPRPFWSALPGGMPYLVIDPEGEPPPVEPVGD